MSLPLLSHDTAGEGPALLLLHSAVCDRRMWDPQWRMFLDAGFRVLRCDFRGHGDTPAPDGPYRDATDVCDLLDALGVAETAVVASSSGGAVALELAARRPERVTALVLLNTGSPAHPPSAALRGIASRERALIEAGDVAGAVELGVHTWLGPEADANTRAVVRLMRRRALDMRPAAEDAGRAGAAAFRPEDVKAPTLAVSGAHDLHDFRQVAAGLPNLLPAAEHVELPWAGHLPNLERPAETALLVLDFVERHTAGARGR
ncbi:alpha/beta fold hydrolase [Streptomyces sp. MP131-18]|uniref:alpha/beta fold hydrolase n=1 Tax=Streptomyces sp. MP131-18 TaxID=1857892 RepID=UPI00097CB177|nr:alpha/beta fold hydrolase [Streptomyces sp. MP131-18]ONK10701.1 N-acyl homoserine lactonase [Streptomyces sp. MP131-18]